MKKGFITPVFIILAVIVLAVVSSFIYFSKQKAKSELKKEKVTLTSGEQQINLKIYGTIVYLPSGATLQFEHGQGDNPLPNYVTGEKYTNKPDNFAEISQEEKIYLHNGYRYDLKVLGCNSKTVHDYDDNVDVQKTTDCTLNVKITKGPNLEYSKDIESWNTFESERVNLSFKYPNYWPIVVAPEDRLKNLQYTEDIDFSNVYIPNAGGHRLGGINVIKNSTVKDLDGYILKLKKDYEKLDEEYKKVYEPPEFSFSEIAGQKAVTITQKYTGKAGSLSPKGLHDYTIVNDCLIYRINLIDSNFYFLDQDEKEYVEKIFNKILTTLNFST